MHVPFLDLKAHHRDLWPELQHALEPVLTGAQFVLGPAVERFEKSFAEYVGVRHCVGLNNGTSALHLALLACDIGPGDEVITTPATWISTAWAISYVGARPVFVDIDPVTYTLDPQAVERAITPRTRALLPVHLYGQVSHMEALNEIARRHHLVVIEDAAQAHGACHEGKHAGSLGRVGCFSFYPGKNLGALGEGGCAVTDDEDLAQRIRRLRDHAQDGRHHHVEMGFNMRMEGIQGAALEVKLPYLNGWNTARRGHAEYYREHLEGIPGLELPRVLHSEGHVWHLFVVCLPEWDRDQVRQALAERGVQSGIHYPTPVPFQPAYAHLGYQRGQFPVAEKLMSTCLSLPLFPELTEEQREHVVESVREVREAERTNGKELLSLVAS